MLKKLILLEIRVKVQAANLLRRDIILSEPSHAIINFDLSQNWNYPSLESGGELDP